MLKEYDYSATKRVKGVSDVFIDAENQRKFISHGSYTHNNPSEQEVGITVVPPAPTPTISNTGIFTTITTPSLPSGTTLTQAPTGQAYYYEVYSDNPFSIVFTNGNGQQRKFDGVFDIIVLSTTLPVVLDTVTNQQYTTAQGIFNIGTTPSSSTPNPSDNGTLVSGSFGTSGLTQLGKYIVQDMFKYYGFVPKIYVHNFWRTDTTVGAAVAHPLRVSSRANITTGDRHFSDNPGQRIDYLFDPANGPILTTPSGYTFSHILDQ